MRKVMSAVILALLVAPVAAQSDGIGGNSESVREKLIGSWRLVLVDQQTPDGKTEKLERTGVIMYTRDGHMAVQILAAAHGPVDVGGPVQYEQGGYEAYYGTYDVDAKAHTVTHHVEGALVRTLIGKDLTRVYRFEGRQLILKSSRVDEHWSIVWEHN